MNRGAELPIASGGLSPGAAFAGPPPLIDGESSAGYDDLLARVCETLRPSDVLEQIWVRDIVNLVWEGFRLRRLKASLMSAAAYEGMAQVLEPLIGYPSLTARNWASRDDAAVQKVEAALDRAGLSRDAVAARTLSVRIGDFERIERMMAATEARRHAALQQLDRHRASFALRLRRKLQEVEDAEVKLFGPGAPAREETA